jgi:hypothetical protein
MLEKNEEIKEEKKNQADQINLNYQLKEKILPEHSNTKDKDQNNTLLKINNEETTFTENLECDYYTIPPSTEPLVDDGKDKNSKNGSENELKEISSNSTTQIFKESNISRKSLEKLITENNNEIDKKIIEEEANNIAHSILKIFLIIVELLFGISLSICSLFVLFIVYKDVIINQKLISLFIEPISCLIAIVGMIPCKNTTCKKAVIVLYLWEGLFLFPISFYVSDSLQEENLYLLCHKILIARIILLIVQFLNFILSLVLKVDI